MSAKLRKHYGLNHVLSIPSNRFVCRKVSRQSLFVIFSLTVLQFRNDKGSINIFQGDATDKSGRRYPTPGTGQIQHFEDI